MSAWNREPEYGKDFAALRSYLGQSQEALAVKIAIDENKIDKIENSSDYSDLDIDTLFKIFYFGKTNEEYEYFGNPTVNIVAGGIAKRAHEEIKKRVLAKEIKDKGITTNEKELDLSEYNFVRLLLATMIIRNYQPPVVDKKELEADLNAIRDDEKYNTLFTSLDVPITLTEAFEQACKENIVIRIEVGSSDNGIYLINITEKDAKNTIKDYDSEDFLKMVSLVDLLKEENYERIRERGPILQKIQTIKKYEG